MKQLDGVMRSITLSVLPFQTRHIFLHNLTAETHCVPTALSAEVYLHSILPTMFNTTCPFTTENREPFIYVCFLLFCALGGGGSRACVRVCVHVWVSVFVI